MLDEKAKQDIIHTFRGLFFRHGEASESGGWSPAGQSFRFEKLTQISDLQGRRVLDLGCGIGDLYPFLLSKFGNVDYTGIDIVPEVIEFASQKYPGARFQCLDLLQDEFDESFDYVLMSGVFNKAIPGCTGFLREMVFAAFQRCTMGLGFNFTSSHVNYTQPEMAYHDPIVVFDFCLCELSPKISLHHHYERHDVAIFVYR